MNNQSAPFNSDDSSPLPRGADAMATERDALQFANNSPVLVSLLYDLDLLPEQLGKDSPKWGKMLTVVAHFKRVAEDLRDAQELDAKKTVEIKTLTAINDCLRLGASKNAEREAKLRESSKNDFSRGWFACLATLCKLEGLADPSAKELWGAGGRGDGADPCDLETLAGYGLRKSGGS